MVAPPEDMSVEEKTEAPKVSKLPTIIQMDEDDILRIENIVLKERNFELEKEKSHNELFARMVSKYKIDLTKFELSVDAPSKRIILTPK